MRVALTICVALALSATLLGSASSAAPENEKAARSRALTTAPQPSFERPAARYGNADQAKRAAAQAWAEVPLPAGGNFNGVRFEEAEGLNDVDLQLVGQYNAVCQWLRAARDGREAATAQSVLEDLPRWSMFRGQPQGEMLAQAIRELRRGGGPTAAGVMADCDALHAREVSFAQQTGQPPSS